MRRHAIGIIGIVLVVVGLIGAAAVAVLASSGRLGTSTSTPRGGMMRRVPRGRGGGGGGAYGGYATPGERIFFTGLGRNGPIQRQGGIGMMASAGCANCHGRDGRGGTIGGMMRGGGITVPDIRYSTMTAPKSEEGTTQPGWSNAQIEAAIREGKDPDGGTLSTYMPRWDMDDTDMRDLLVYLKELK